MAKLAVWWELMAACSMILVSSANSAQYQNYNYQYQYRNPPQRHSLYLPTQKYVAVPGTIVQRFVQYPVAPVLAPLVQRPLQRLALPPIQNSYRVSLLPPRFRMEADSESSSPPPEDSEEMNQQIQPQPGTEPGQQPPPDSGSEPPPEEPPPNQQEEQPQGEDHQSHPHHHKIIHKHISIHIPPEDMEEEEEVTVVRPKIPQPDKQVNIVFIKAPAPKRKKFEVVLPDKPEEKTLIYILVKKTDPTDSIRVRGPPPTKEPPKPQVFFIKYKHNQDGNNGGYRILAAKKQNSYHL